MKHLAISLIVFCSLSFSSHLSAQCAPKDPSDPRSPWVLPDGSPCPNTILTAVPFLTLAPDARGAAMGDAGIAVSPDANAMHYNVSKLAFIEEPTSLSMTYSPWLRALGLTDVYMAYLAGHRQINELQTIAGSLRYFSLGQIDFTDDNGEPTGMGKPNEFELAGAYARKLTDKLSAGLAIKFIYSNLAADQFVNGTEIKAGLAGAADISFSYIAPYDGGTFRAGLAFKNLGTKISYSNDNADYIPANMGLGAAWDLNLDDYNTLTLTADFNKLLVPTAPREFVDENANGIPDYKEYSVVNSWFTSFGDAPEGFSEELKEISISAGLEYWYNKQFAVRGGYFHESNIKGDRKYLTVGLGIKYNIFGLNLSYLVPTSNQRNPLDNTLRFSIIFNFAGGGDN